LQDLRRKTFQAVGELRFEDDADNVRYDETRKKIYLGFGSGGIANVNAADGKRVGFIKLSAHPEAFQLEKKGSRIFVNVPNWRHVAVVDRNKGKVVARWKTDLALANFPMALDEADHRLFVDCRLPPRLVVLNTDSGDVIAKTDISGDCDDVFYDSKRHRIYAICGAGKIDIIDQTDPNTLYSFNQGRHCRRRPHRTLRFGTRHLVRSRSTSRVAKGRNPCLPYRIILQLSKHLRLIVL
jgi:outer membrane protein assembly factor BamB